MEMAAEFVLAAEGGPSTDLCNRKESEELIVLVIK